MLVFVAVSGDQIIAVDGAIDGDFAFAAAADGADFFALGGTEAFWFSPFTDGAGHGKQNTPCSGKKQKRRSRLEALRCSGRAGAAREFLPRRRGCRNFYVFGAESHADEAGWESAKPGIVVEKADWEREFVEGGSAA